MLLFLSFAWADSFLSYHERILKQNGEPLRGTVAIKIQILAPDVQDCVLYEENQTVSVVNGVFSLKIGEGDKAGSTQLADVFQNGKTLTGLSSCGGSYKADLNSGRLLKVLFRDEQSTDWEELPVTAINFVPLAIESRAVGGFRAKDLLRVEGSGEESGIPSFSKAQFTTFVEFLEDLVHEATTGGAGSSLGTVKEIKVQPPLEVVYSMTKPRIALPAAGPTQGGYLKKEVGRDLTTSSIKGITSKVFRPVAILKRRVRAL